jgi:hypothetical protein
MMVLIYPVALPPAIELVAFGDQQPRSGCSDQSGHTPAPSLGRNRYLLALFAITWTTSL